MKNHKKCGHIIERDGEYWVVFNEEVVSVETAKSALGFFVERKRDYLNFKFCKCSTFEQAAELNEKLFSEHMQSYKNDLNSNEGLKTVLYIGAGILIAMLILSFLAGIKQAIHG